jgi:hypothetical protein
MRMVGIFMRRFPKTVRAGAGSSCTAGRGAAARWDLGGVDAVPLARARELAAKCRLDLAEGRNPLESRRAAHEAERRALDARHVADARKKTFGQVADEHGLSAMSRAHREILHQARLLARLAHGLRAEDADKYLIRDAQRVIGSIEALVRIHNAQEEDIYDEAVSI